MGVNTEHNEPTQRKEMESGLQDDNGLGTASPPKMKKMCEKQKSKPLNPLFSTTNDIPVFSLPICKRTQTMIRLVNDAEVLPALYDKYENYDCSKEKCNE